MGEGVPVGRNMGDEVTSDKRMGAPAAGVKISGWNGVGVGDGFGADVIRIKGKEACSDDGEAAPQADKKIARTRRGAC